MVLISVVFVNPVFDNDDAIFVGWIWISLFILATILNIGFLFAQYIHHKDLKATIKEEYKKAKMDSTP